MLRPSLSCDVASDRLLRSAVTRQFTYRFTYQFTCQPCDSTGRRYSHDETGKIVLDLVERPVEEEWFEFKENWYQSRELGEYISCLSNAAAFEGVEAGYLVWGVNNVTHEIVGADFTWKRDVKNEPLEHFLARMTSPDIAFKFDEIAVRGRQS